MTDPSYRGWEKETFTFRIRREANTNTMIGRMFGHYIVLEKIGAGGMGEVYRARDQHLERDVALKILPPGAVTNETARRRFRREALALSKLNHPNIATVFDFDTHENVDFLAMELIAGTPLSDRLKAGPLPAEEAAGLAVQLAEGLSAAHARGVIHRDLKPGNLMVTEDGRLKILDFGLAVLMHSERDPEATRGAETTEMAGTVPYMSPEQLRGKPVDARTDIYAAGTVLYEMVAGQRPFAQTRNAELISAILQEKPAPPTTVTGGVTSGIGDVIMKSLEKEPSERYQSARELATALMDLDSRPSRSDRRSRRYLTRGAAAAVLLITGLILALNVGGLRDRVFNRTAAEQGGVPSAPAVRARRSVAVLGFKNLAGREDQAWISTALAEMLTTELAAGEA